MNPQPSSPSTWALPATFSLDSLPVSHFWEDTVLSDVRFLSCWKAATQPHQGISYLLGASLKDSGPDPLETFLPSAGTQQESRLPLCLQCCCSSP